MGRRGRRKPLRWLCPTLVTATRGAWEPGAMATSFAPRLAVTLCICMLAAFIAGIVAGIHRPAARCATFARGWACVAARTRDRWLPAMPEPVRHPRLPKAMRMPPTNGGALVLRSLWDHHPLRRCHRSDRSMCGVATDGAMTASSTCGSWKSAIKEPFCDYLRCRPSFDADDATGAIIMEPPFGSRWQPLQRTARLFCRVQVAGVQPGSHRPLPAPEGSVSTIKAGLDS